MKNDKWINKNSDSLFKAVLNLKNLDEARMFFRDLLTEAEIKEFASRWKVANMLTNNIPYSRIEKETGLSSTTIARVSKWLNSGMNGYKTLIKRIKENKVSHHSPA
jgi:TrpR-related protein YerC/YecD